MKITLVLIFFVFFTDRKVHSAKCNPPVANETHCKCEQNEHYSVDYGNLTISSLMVSSCDNVEITNFMGAASQDLKTIKIENIKNTLEFCPILIMEHLHKIVIFNVGSVPEFISECTFNRANKLDHFHIKNTVIGKFFNTFNMIEVGYFILKNVTILNMESLDFRNGTELEIIDSYINVTSRTPDALSFNNFDRIIIKNTVLIFPEGCEKILIKGNHVHLSDNVFINANVTVEGTEDIYLRNTCADGKGSEIHLVSKNPRNEYSNHRSILSHGNRYSGKITYSPNQEYEIKNNSLCKEAKCNCIVKKPYEYTPPQNYGNTIHQEASHVFLFCFTIIASAIVTRI